MRSFFLVCLLFFGFNVFCQTTGKATKPNIIFILVDDLGYGDVGIFHQNARKAKKDPAIPFLITPSLDKMASNGAMLTQQYANAPVCVSSRSSLLTGVTQGNAVVRNNQFDRALEDNYTIASTLKTLGYETVAIGKWGLQGKDDADWPGHPLKRGFDYFYGYMRHVDGHEHYPKEGLYRKPKEVYEDTTNVADGLDKCYTGDLWTAKAKQWIVHHAEKKKSTPFFMYLAYDTPHAVLELPTQAYPAGSGLKGGLKWLGTPGKMINTASGTIDSWFAPEFEHAKYLDRATGEMVPWKDVNKRYATVVQRLDAQVGDVLQLLKDLKIDKNTIVVFTSDNGPSNESYLREDYSPEFFQGYGPFDGIKRDQWEGGMRTPTIVQWTGTIANAKKVIQPSFLSDWMPTFLEAAGSVAPARVNSVSLLPSLTGKGKQEDKVLYSEYFVDGKTPDYKDFEPNHRNRMRKEMQFLRSGNYVGVRYNIQAASDDFEIYDVVRDPKQSTNLAKANPGLQKIFKERALQMRIASAEAQRPYDSALVAAVNPTQARAGKTVFYQGEFPWLPQTDNLSPFVSGTKSGRPTVVKKTGYIKVPLDGAYHFSVDARDKAFLRIHDISVADADYGYQGGETSTSTIFLKKGLHPFTLVSKTDGKEITTTIFWTGPGFDKRAIEKKDIF